MWHENGKGVLHYRQWYLDKLFLLYLQKLRNRWIVYYLCETIFLMTMCHVIRYSEHCHQSKWHDVKEFGSFELWTNSHTVIHYTRDALYHHMQWDKLEIVIRLVVHICSTVLNLIRFTLFTNDLWFLRVEFFVFQEITKFLNERNVSHLFVWSRVCMRSFFLSVYSNSFWRTVNLFVQRAKIIYLSGTETENVNVERNDARLVKVSKNKKLN